MKTGDTTTKIVWECGHQWYARNTPTNPDSGKDAKAHGCPYCGCKKIRSSEELYFGKPKFRGKGVYHGRRK